MADELSSRPGRVVARLARQVELAVATVDLTLSQYRVLGILGDGREAASALAYKLAVSRPSITGVIDGLVARGLVTRDHDPLDRRRIGLDLTGEGKRVMALADAEVDRRLGEIATFATGDGDDAYAGLDAWRGALDGFLADRLCARRDASDAEVRAGVAT
jgi:long-chain acyl-CoA synthetase